MMIYHYTTLENLALIIKNQTLRFNRLTQVDDQDEGITADYGSLGDFVFVSCWTNKDTENIVLWNMYARDMTGIRIGINSENIPFDFLYDGTDVIKNIQNLKKQECAFLYYYNNSDSKFIPVEYNKNETPNLIHRNDKKWPIIQLNKIAALKSEEWQCQQEIRFVLCGATTENKSSVGIIKEITSKQEKNPISNMYLDLQLDEGTFTEMEILLSPKSSEAQEIICKALIKTYLPSVESTIQIKKSRLKIR